MISVTYVSSATQLFEGGDLAGLLAQCRANNARLGLTGMLLYKDGNFIQVLEGDAEVLRNLYGRISMDSRHCGMIKLLDHPIETRQFSEWSMAFWNLNTIDPASIPGYSNLMNTSFTAPAFQFDPSRAQKLLLNFRNSL